MSTFVDSEPLQGCWYPVARADEVHDKPHAVRLLGEDLVIWRDATDALVVAPDRCPHREAPLSIGSLEAGVLSCAYHGWAFGRRRQVRRHSLVWTRRHDSTRSTSRVPQGRREVRLDLGVPGRADNGDPRNRPGGRPGISAHQHTGRSLGDIDAAAGRQLHGLQPLSVGAQPATFGGAQDPYVPKIDLEQLDDEFFGYRYEVEASNPDEAVAVSGSEEDTVHRVMTTGFSLPFVVRSTIRYDDGLEHILLLLSTPVDDLNSLFTFVVWRNDDHSTDPDEIIAFDRAIGAEDKAMLEQVPGTLDLSRTGVANVQSDKPSVEWRRRFAELIGFSE